MADSVTEEYRPLYLEDFGVSTTLATTTATVLGIGPGVTVTPVAVAAVSDADAASKGVPLGGIYLWTKTVPNYLKARLS